MITVNGEKLLEDINKNIRFYNGSVTETYRDQLKLISSSINKNQKYKTIVIFSKCDNRSVEFVFQLSNTGVYLMLGFDEIHSEIYHLMLKK